MKVISRDEAISQGLKKYFTGNPCKHGHVAPRVASTGACCECLKEYNKKYRKQGREKTPEILKQHKKHQLMSEKFGVMRRKEAKEKGLKYYFTGKPCEHGHISPRYISTAQCCECREKFRAKIKDRVAEYNKSYNAKNKVKIAEQQEEYRKRNKVKIAKQQKEYRKQNPAPKFIRHTLDRILTDWKGGRKKMEKLHGYTFEQLKQRIEFQFKDGMSWDNRSEWHIDHRKPISRFLEHGITDPKIVNALSNLQPLWAKDNLEKSNKWKK